MVLEDIQLTIDKIWSPTVHSRAPALFLKFRDKGPGTDSANLMIKIFSQSIQLTVPVPKVSFDSEK